jgi:hypothetical protein
MQRKTVPFDSFERFCSLIQTPPRTIRDRRKRGSGPRWTKLEGSGRLYVTVAGTRRFLTRCVPASHQ